MDKRLDLLRRAAHPLRRFTGAQVYLVAGDFR